MGFADVHGLSQSDFDGTPKSNSFGSRRTDVPITLCCTDWIDGQWQLTKDELTGVVRRLEPRAERWLTSSKLETVSYWWFETVRAPKGVKISADDFLVMAFYPDTTAECPIATFIDVIPFKKNLKDRKTRRLDPLSRTFENEEAFFEWIESQTLDFWQQSDFLVARSARPFQLLSSNTYAAPKLAFGLLRGKEAFDTIQKSVLERCEVQQLLLHGLNGGSPSEQSLSLSLSLENVLHQVPASALLHFDIALKMALAGPLTASSNWKEKPIWEIVINLYPIVGAYALRHKTDPLPVEPTVFVAPDPSESQPAANQNAEDLYAKLRQLEIKKSDIERRIRSTESNLSAIEASIQNAVLEKSKKPKSSRRASKPTDE